MVLFVDFVINYIIKPASNYTSTIMETINVPVDCGTIVLLFIDIRKLEVKGQINTVTYDDNYVHKWCIMKSSDNLLVFNLLILVEYRQFVLQIDYSDLEVISLI